MCSHTLTDWRYIGLAAQTTKKQQINQLLGIPKVMTQHHHIKSPSFWNAMKTTLQVKQREINSKRNTFLH